MNGLQGAANGHDPIEWEIENAIHGLQSFARESLAGLGGGRDKNRTTGKSPLQAFGERFCGQHFADRDTA